MYPCEVIISTFGRDLANDVAKYNHVLSTTRRAVCTFPTFYCPKVSRFDVSCNRPLRFSRAVGDNWRYHRRNISECPARNALALSFGISKPLSKLIQLSFLPMGETSSHFRESSETVH